MMNPFYLDMDDLLESGDIFFTGCNHFDHAKIIGLAKRPFQTVEQMNEIMVERWNQAVEPNDTVIHLGDFAWANHQKWRDRLNGTLIQIQGNHDHGVPWDMVPYLELISKDYPRVVCFHYPIEEWNGWYRGSMHVHCHTHAKEVLTAERRFNVAVEAHDHSPVSLSEVLEGANVVI